MKYTFASLLYIGGLLRRGTLNLFYIIQRILHGVHRISPIYVGMPHCIGVYVVLLYLYIRIG